jgi:hypothetical protein
VNADRTEARAAVTIASACSIICRASAWAWADMRVASAAATNRSPACTAAIASATPGNAGTGFILTLPPGRLPLLDYWMISYLHISALH